MDRITVLIGIPNGIYRAKLATAVAQQGDMQVAGEAADGPTAGNLAEARQPDVLLMEVERPYLAGSELLRRFRAKSPGTKVVLLAGEPEDAFGAEVLAAGAKGYLPTGVPPDECINAIRHVASGGIWAGPNVLAKAVEHLVEKTSQESVSPPEGRELLTGREHEVIHWAGLGKTNKEIAGQLGVGEQTVKTHLRNVFRKLEITRRAQIILRRF